MILFHAWEFFEVLLKKDGPVICGNKNQARLKPGFTQIAMFDKTFFRIEGQLFKSGFCSCSRHFRKLLFLTPSTIQSLSRLSARHAQILHVLARDLRAAMYASIDSSCLWFCLLKINRSYGLTSPIANLSKFSTIFDKVFCSVSSANCIPL